MDIPPDIYTGLGCLKNFEYKLDIVENPKFDIHPPRIVPYKIRNEVQKELEQMVKLGVIEKQEAPTPVVNAMVIPRKNKKLRVCIDPTEVNKNILRRHYPLTTMEDISSRLSNSKWFTILDCKKGFWQIQVEKESQKYLTFSTPWGRYSYKRLPFGLSTAPEISQ